MKFKLLIASAMTLASTTGAQAWWWGGGCCSGGGWNNVPEIDALSGMAAVGVIGAAVALIRERSKG